MYTKARYINPLTDFGFKRIFGTESNKDLLIDFLNAVLDIEGGIKDLRYDNTERQGRAEIDRRAIFDLYCITGKGEHIIVEMQNVRQDYFKDRALYYASFPIQAQGEKNKFWDFELTPVYSVNILNFKFGNSLDDEKQYFYDVRLTDKISHRIFYNKLAFIFMELPNFVKKEHELDDNIDRWMYVLKHLTELQDLPDALRNRVFEKLCRVAEIAKMKPEERKSYDQSLKEYRDMYLMENALEKKEALLKEKDVKIQEKDAEIQEKDVKIQEKNIEIQVKNTEIQTKNTEIQEINAELKQAQEANETMIRILLEAGVSVEKIAASTGLGIADINRVRKKL